MNFNNSYQKFRGFSLLELMIAMVLGMMLIGGVFQVAISNIQTFSSTNGLSRVQEGARTTLYELSKNIRMANFKGCDSQGINISNVTGAGNQYDLTNAITGYNNVSENFTGVTGVTPLAQTDVLQIKQLIDEGIFLTSVANANDTTLSVNNSESLKDGDVIFIGDCEKGGVFTVNGNPTNAQSLAITATGAISPNNKSYDPATPIYKLEVKTYFVMLSSYVNNQGNRMHALWVKVNDDAAQALVVGVDDLQVLYGVDNNDDLSPNQFMVGGAGGLDMDKVRVVRLQVTTTSLDAVGAKGQIKRDFSVSVTLRNQLIAGI